VKCNFKSIIIERDPMTKIPKLAAPWEVPVYRSQYGDEKVEISEKDTEVEIAALPDAEEEYLRLRDVFGIEPDTKQSHVDLVYGRGAQAIKPLREAIKASVAGDVEKAQKVADGGAKVDKETAEKREAAYVDPLEADEFTIQRSQVGPLPQRGLAAEVQKAADQKAEKEAAEKPAK
jgi:hypothetical protein